MKAFYLSKTFWVQVVGLVVLALGTQLPGLSDFLKNYFSEVGAGWAFLNIVLRLVTKQEVTIS